MKTSTTAKPAENPLAALRLPQEYQAENAKQFRNLDTLRYTLRKHRDELVRSGAIVKVAGRTFVEPTILGRTLLELGARDAARRVR